MRDLVNSTYFNPIYGHACYIQTNDIDLENESWIPIGLGFNDDNGNIGQGEYNWRTRMFYGSYDGNKKYIKNLSVNGNWKQAALFGYIRGNESVIRDLVVYGNVNVPDSQNSGGIVGQMQYSSTIENCAFIGDVTGGSSPVDTYSAGGIAGYVWAGGTISNCYHNGNVTSSKYAGGITETVRFGSANLSGDASKIENCYQANGIVSGGEYSGAVVGTCAYYKNIDNYVYIKNCYASSDANANELSQDATSDNTMLLPKSLLKKIAEDLGSAYVDNADSNLNDGYPVFSWQLGQSVSLMGDINDDGEFNISDAVILQKWLLAIPNVKLTNWKAADFYEDDRLDVFDLCLMKKMLIE